MDNPVEKFLKENGGALKVSADLGEKAGTVRMWKLRRRIPREKWPDIIENLKVPLEVLRGIERAA